MEQIMNYVKPELLIVAVVLYFIGIGIKKSETISDKYIPAILGVLGILVCGIHVIATCNLYCNYTRNSRGRSEQLCESVFKTIEQRRIERTVILLSPGHRVTCQSR